MAHDHRVGAVLVVADVHAEGPLGEVDPGHVVGDDLGAEALGLGTEARHQIGAHDPVDEAGVVLDVARDHELSASGEALDDERSQVGAGSVERCGVAGRPSADHDQLARFCFRH